MSSQAEKLLSSVYSKLSLTSDADKYTNIYQIIDELELINTNEKIAAQTTGKITESLVEIGLKLSAENSFFPVTQRNFKWVGDFALMGIPFNVIISVKSFSAKERLLVSGSGSALAPTIGYGWFKYPSEFENEKRLGSYKLRGFTSIYMPKYTYDELPKVSKQFKNLNGKLFLRLIESFPEDITDVMVNNNFVGASGLKFADPFKL